MIFSNQICRYLGTLFLILISILLVSCSNFTHSCGSEFNSLYEDHLSRSLDPEFCSQLDTIDVKYFENMKGFRTCVAFNGHEFSRFNGVSYPGDDPLKSVGSDSTYDVDFGHPISKGACIESYSVASGKNYCDLITSSNTYRSGSDECVSEVALQLNDLKLCEATTEPGCKNGSENCYQSLYHYSRYECYSDIGEARLDAELCKNIPTGKSGQVDYIRNQCLLEIAKKTDDESVCNYMTYDESNQAQVDCSRHFSQLS